MFDAIVFSDLHLGSTSCQVEAIQAFLDALQPTARLVLNGDVLENTEHRLNKHHWRVLSRLRKLSDQLELIWVRGNHDFDAEAVAHLIGAEFVPEYRFESGDQSILCVHGDAWDRFLTDHPVVTSVADWFYPRIQRMSRRLAARAKRNSKTFLRCAEKVRTAAIEYARTRQANVIICGHTHHAEAPSDLPGVAPAYFNSGCWTDFHCQYITVLDGVARLEEVDTESLPVAEVLVS